MANLCSGWGFGELHCQTYFASEYSVDRVYCVSSRPANRLTRTLAFLFFPCELMCVRRKLRSNHDFPSRSTAHGSVIALDSSLASARLGSRHLGGGLSSQVAQLVIVLLSWSSGHQKAAVVALAAGCRCILCFAEASLPLELSMQNSFRHVLVEKEEAIP